MIELLIVLLIAAILGYVALPSLGTFLARQQSATAAQELADTALYARERAIHTNSTAQLALGTLVAGCGAQPVVWAVTVGGAADRCMPPSTFASRFGASTQVKSPTVVVNYTPMGLATSTVDSTVTFTRGTATSTVTLYAGGAPSVH